MRIVVHGQQAFGKSVLEALLNRGEDVGGVFCAPAAPGGRVDPLAGSRRGARLARVPAQVVPQAGGAGHLCGPGKRPVRDGLRDAVRPRRGAEPAAPRHHPVPPVAAAAPPRAELDQLADHLGREADGPDDFLARQRPRHRADPAAEDRWTSQTPTPWEACISTSFTPWAWRRCWRRWIRCATARRRKSRKTRRTPPTKAGAARSRSKSTGTSPSTRCGTSSAAPTRNPAPGVRWPAGRYRFMTPANSPAGADSPTRRNHRRGRGRHSSVAAIGGHVSTCSASGPPAARKWPPAPLPRKPDCNPASCLGGS